MRTPVRVAVVGLGRWGRTVAGKIDSLPQADLRWLCDHNPESQRRVATRYVNARVASDFDDLVNDEAVDGIVVATPAVSHYELTRRALEGDKHVLVQRPLALRGDHADDLVRHAEHRDRRLVVGNSEFFHPGLRRLKKLLSQRRLGEVFYLYSCHQEAADAGSRGDALWTLGPYDVSIALHLLEDEPIEIVADCGAYLEPGITDVAHCHLRFATGISAHVFLSRLDPRCTCTVGVVGSRKTAVFDAGRPNRNLTVFDGQGDIVSPHLPHEDLLRLECDHFVAAIRAPGSANLTGREGAAVVNVLERLQRVIEHDGVFQDPSRRGDDANVVRLISPTPNGETVH
jgi:predicted dehydrogenase